MRCNVGINPQLLTVPHLVAEYRELPMIVGSLRVNDYVIKSSIPPQFNLGKGHMNFLKNKLIYITKRYGEVVKEMNRRGFKSNIDRLDISSAPLHLLNDWIPGTLDTYILRNRIIEKIKMKPLFYKIHDVDMYSKKLLETELFYV